MEAKNWTKRKYWTPFYDSSATMSDGYKQWLVKITVLPWFTSMLLSWMLLANKKTDISKQIPPYELMETQMDIYELPKYWFKNHF